jgi:hypothetical protein
MKRYRVMAMDFDSRALAIGEMFGVGNNPEERERSLRSATQTISGVAGEAGLWNLAQKVVNLRDLGPAPFSLIAFHNNFFRQVRAAFIQGSYYPALTGACALGERILNHLVLVLRDEFKNTPQYKKVHNKDSFDNWSSAIETLVAWDVMLPHAATAFGQLEADRHQAIHFNPIVDTSARELALDAIKKLSTAIDVQFGAFGLHPWYIPGIPGATFVKKEFEARPFVAKVVLPGAFHVGPYHIVRLGNQGWEASDLNDYPEANVTDEQFGALYRDRNPEQLAKFPYE